MKPPASVVLVLVVTAGAVVGCGKKGDPQAPLRPVPSGVTSFAAERVGGAVTLRFNVPAGNREPGTPSATERVDVYALTLAASAPAPSVEQLTVASNVVKAIPIRREGGAGQTDSPMAGPGEMVTYADTVSLPSDGGPFVRYYAAAGWAGRRRGAVSPILAVPIGAGPLPPTTVTSRHDESTVTLSWQASGAGQRFVVDLAGPGEQRTRLTAEPVAAAEFSLPVRFGAEQCFVVRTVEVVGAVTLIGDPTAASCITPADRFPPAPPSELRGFPGDTSNELTWTASPSSDVAGYIVLRGEGTSDTLQRLTAAPVTATQYRDETVRSGVAYTYVVLAIDRATPPNESRPSNREIVIARLRESFLPN